MDGCIKINKEPLFSRTTSMKIIIESPVQSDEISLDMGTNVKKMKNISQIEQEDSRVRDGIDASVTDGTFRSDSGRKLFICSYCGFTSDWRKIFIQHVNNHLDSIYGNKPFECNSCSYRTKTSGNLNLHKRTHTGEKRFGCILCNYKCDRTYDMKRHLRVHTREKPYECSICVYKCTTSFHLTRHMKKHTDNGKPFACTLCYQKFAQFCFLKRHMKIHS